MNRFIQVDGAGCVCRVCVRHGTHRNTRSYSSANPRSLTPFFSYIYVQVRVSHTCLVETETLTQNDSIKTRDVGALKSQKSRNTSNSTRRDEEVATVKPVPNWLTISRIGAVCSKHRDRGPNRFKPIQTGLTEKRSRLYYTKDIQELRQRIAFTLLGLSLLRRLSNIHLALEQLLAWHRCGGISLAVLSRRGKRADGLCCVVAIPSRVRLCQMSLQGSCHNISLVCIRDKVCRQAIALPVHARRVPFCVSANCYLNRPVSTWLLFTALLEARSIWTV